MEDKNTSHVSEGLCYLSTSVKAGLLGLWCAIPGVTAEQQNISAVHQNLQKDQEGLRPNHCRGALQGTNNLQHKVLHIQQTHTAAFVFNSSNCLLLPIHLPNLLPFPPLFLPQCLQSFSGFHTALRSHSDMSSGQWTGLSPVVTGVISGGIGWGKGGNESPEAALHLKQRLIS